MKSLFAASTASLLIAAPAWAQDTKSRLADDIIITGTKAGVFGAKSASLVSCGAAR